MGWVPFDSCPDSELLEITNQTQTPLVWERDARDDSDISGTFVFQENQTAVPDTLLDFYVVPVQEIANIPGSAATPERSLGVVTTDSEGNFSLRAFASGVSSSRFVRDCRNTLATRIDFQRRTGIFRHNQH